MTDYIKRDGRSMSRYIDADKIEYEDMLRPRGNGNYEECQIAYRDQIDDIPTADVRENVKGEWQITDAYPHNVYCSNCHKKFAQTHWAVWEDGSLPRNYCPNCGADMRQISALSKNAEIGSNLKKR